MPCRTLGTYGACTRRSRSLWAVDRECYLNTSNISHIDTYVWVFTLMLPLYLTMLVLMNTFRIEG
ncbi:hypothetical protein Hanom_Chr10g00877221 [Helianthus anomalus]